MKNCFNVLLSVLIILFSLLNTARCPNTQAKLPQTCIFVSFLLLYQIYYLVVDLKIWRTPVTLKFIISKRTLRPSKTRSQFPLILPLVWVLIFYCKPSYQVSNNISHKTILKPMRLVRRHYKIYHGNKVSIPMA